MERSVVLPLPPSVNALYANRKATGPKKRGRIITPEYAAWRQWAGIQLNQSGRWKIGGAVCIFISLPTNMPGDIDNRAKAPIDLLVEHGRIDDDRNVVELHVRRCWADSDTCRIEVRASAGKG